MKRELSQKEREEPVNKGYLEDLLDSRDYVTKAYFHTTLEEVLESKNYITKDWAMDMFETFQKSIENNLRSDFEKHTQLLIKQNQEDFQRHTNSLVEMIRHENHIVAEAIMSRVERVERYVGLDAV